MTIENETPIFIFAIIVIIVAYYISFIAIRDLIRRYRNSKSNIDEYDKLFYRIIDEDTKDDNGTS